MKKPNKKYTAAVIVGLIAAGILILFFTKNYPFALVGNNFISVKSWENQLAIAKRLDSKADPDKIREQLIKIEKQKALIDELKIDYEKGFFSKEWLYEKMANESQYRDILNKYFSGDEKLYYKYVSDPQAYDTLLRIKYNSDFNANQAYYDKVQRILNDLNAGKSFEDLAKLESDDKFSGQLGGDLGFVFDGEILPELWFEMVTAESGKHMNKIVISRLGYHILYPVEKSEQDKQTVYHVKHILVKTEGYESWLSAELEKIRVWRLY